MRFNEFKVRIRVAQLIGLEIAAIAFFLMLIVAGKGGMP